MTHLKPARLFYLLVALVSLITAGFATYKEAYDLAVFYFMTACWTFIDYRWHSLCIKQRDLIRKLMEKYHER